MEPKFKWTNNGQELQQQDASDGNASGFASQAALADDRVLWELLRLKPQAASPQKFVIPWGHQGWGKLDSTDGNLKNTALVQGETADAKVRVMPFRAIIASQDTSSNIEKLRGIRSGYHIGASTLYTSLTISANASGNPRWTLIYAQVTPAANSPGVTRYTKDPNTSVVSSASLVTTTNCSVSIIALDGTPAASPTLPALPADGGGNFNIALAYLWIPNGFGGLSSVGRGAIREVAPCVQLLSSTGTIAAQPANQSYTVGGTIDTRQSHQQALRPGAYLPPTMAGLEFRTILVQNGFPPISHADADVVDNSIDWRWRYFWWFVHVLGGSTSTSAFASDRNETGTLPAGSALRNTQGTHMFHGHGQSFVGDTGNSPAIAYTNDSGLALYIDDTLVSQLGATTKLELVVDSTNGGLVLKKSGAGSYQAVIYLIATAPYSNFTAAL